MFPRRKKNVPASYTASNFLLTYFIIGLLILSLAFVFYTKQIFQLNRDLNEQIPPLAGLVSEIPVLNDMRLANKLTQIFKESLSASRLSFIITDAETGEVIIAQGVDKSIERKINAHAPVLLSPSEESKLRNILERMKKRNDKPQRDNV